MREAERKKKAKEAAEAAASVAEQKSTKKTAKAMAADKLEEVVFKDDGPPQTSGNREEEIMKGAENPLDGIAHNLDNKTAAPRKQDKEY